MSKIDDLPQVEATSRAQWRAWLEANHTRSEGVWVVTYKKHCGDRYVAWPEIVQEALCLGFREQRCENGHLACILRLMARFSTIDGRNSPSNPKPAAKSWRKVATSLGCPFSHRCSRNP